MRRVYTTMFPIILDSLLNGGVVQGTNFWVFNSPGKPTGPGHLGLALQLLSCRNLSSTALLIMQMSCNARVHRPQVLQPAVV